MTLDQLRTNRDNSVRELAGSLHLVSNPRATVHDFILAAIQTTNVMLAELLVMVKEREPDVVGMRQTLEDLSGGLAAVLPDLTMPTKEAVPTKGDQIRCPHGVAFGAPCEDCWFGKSTVKG